VAAHASGRGAVRVHTFMVLLSVHAVPTLTGLCSVPVKVAAVAVRQCGGQPRRAWLTARARPCSGRVPGTPTPGHISKRPRAFTGSLRFSATLFRHGRMVEGPRNTRAEVHGLLHEWQPLDGTVTFTVRIWAPILLLLAGIGVGLPALARRRSAAA
jgi:hypothetical protein